MFDRIFITGDTHGVFERIYFLCENFDVTNKDLLIVAGDFGINYYLNKKEQKNKYKLNELPINLLIVRGNHEKRPEKIDTYKSKEWNKGIVYYEEEYPTLLFAKDGEVFELNDKKVFCCGGAYSVDKFYRLENHLSWFEDEQLTSDEMDTIFNSIKDKKFDYVVTHTCPLRYIPTEMFLPMVDQSKVDNTMEKWLDKVFDNIEFKKWYCGHYHTNKSIDNIRFLFNDIVEIGG